MKIKTKESRRVVGILQNNTNALAARETGRGGGEVKTSQDQFGRRRTYNRTQTSHRDGGGGGISSSPKRTCSCARLHDAPVDLEVSPYVGSGAREIT